ncbi:hypothetical protein [Methanotorris formicicus]|uniref:Uncharacterized protein n=1 Tax=Methanotorris formicicus Mc-S-70 TaxID=647171 RepID=H1KZ44_9EURY|nr:hypothetical protein [Methanotorris formicicus]EHP86469.1 hypothetical protein MetfoDRAFT_1067 [Methanotorris formicicus Mc-S-70]
MWVKIGDNHVINLNLMGEFWCDFESLCIVIGEIPFDSGVKRILLLYFEDDGKMMKAYETLIDGLKLNKNYVDISGHVVNVEEAVYEGE